MANDTLIYWDSNVFIDLIEKTPARYQVLEGIVNSAERGEVRIVTSAMSLVEVSKLNNLGGVLPEWKEKLIVQFFENDYISVRTVDRVVAETARPIIRGHNLKAPDAIHVATALLARAQVLHTYDSQDLLPLDRKIGLPSLPLLRIEEPKWEFQPPLAGLTSVTAP
jgi:predicted nucleic acid-binding protein